MKKSVHLLCASLFFQMSGCFASSCNPVTPPPGMPGYTPFVLLNMSGVVGNTGLYVTAFASEPNNSPSYFILFDTTTGEGATQLAEQSLPGQYSYPFSAFSSGATAPVLYLPNSLNNPSLYVSVDYPIGVQTVSSASSSSG